MRRLPRLGRAEMTPLVIGVGILLALGGFAFKYPEALTLGGTLIVLAFTAPADESRRSSSKDEER